MRFGDFILADGTLDRARLLTHVREFFSRPGATLSVNEETGTCYYRYPSDYSRRCGVGCAIGDDEYVSSIEGDRAHDALFTLGYGGLSVEDFMWVDALQSYHDSADDARHLVGRLMLFSVEDVTADGMEAIITRRV